MQKKTQNTVLLNERRAMSLSQTFIKSIQQWPFYQLKFAAAFACLMYGIYDSTVHTSRNGLQFDRGWRSINDSFNIDFIRQK
jgi:hypothetical protein